MFSCRRKAARDAESRMCHKFKLLTLPRYLRRYQLQLSMIFAYKKEHQSPKNEPIRSQRPSTRTWERQQKGLEGNAEKNRKPSPIRSSRPRTRGVRKQQNISVPATPSAKPRETPTPRLHPKTRQSTQFRQQSGIDSAQPQHLSQDTGNGVERRLSTNKTLPEKSNRGQSQLRPPANQSSLAGKQTRSPQVSNQSILHTAAA